MIIEGCSNANTSPDAAWKQRLRRNLLRWFDKHARPMPWRDRPTPYHVWVSEVMLQQTQVATVVPYFERFIARFPDAASLAAADEGEVLRLWEGLGYYRRARQLHQAARHIVERHDGKFPDDREAIHALPGVGRYTAGAILSIAFGRRAPILEANTKRVLGRLLAYRGAPESTAGQQLLWRFAEDVLPRNNVGAFNQALMELGSEVCAPRNPKCSSCPVASLCPTRSAGLQDQIPPPKRKPAYESVTEAAVIIRRRGRLYLRQRGDDERWAGLWDFPRFSVPSGNGRPSHAALVHGVSETTGLTVNATQYITTLKHGVTRFRITLHCYEAKHVAGRVRDARWLRPSELENYPLSVTGRKISRFAL
ncbi:MAG: A/G-specific adenine glycosylase [Planctomycetes bacterium]|nr:A/G-specific adenine glycosylase [Planctomycetota bacterium]